MISALKLEKPTTLEEAAAAIIRTLNDSERAMMAKDGVAATHHGLGTTIRNHWGLWTGGPLKSHLMVRFGIGHADDMSGLILTCVVHTLRADPRPLEKALAGQVERYKAHWERMGLHPLTLEKAVPDDYRIEPPNEP